MLPMVCVYVPVPCQIGPVPRHSSGDLESDWISVALATTVVLSPTHNTHTLSRVQILSTCD